MNSDLHKQLESLHTELARTNKVDGESRKMLVTILNDISRLLDPAQANEKSDEPLTDQLDELAVRFEAEHPTLGTAIRRVVDALAKAGI